jgi:hypothetical protein
MSDARNAFRPVTSAFVFAPVFRGFTSLPRLHRPGAGQVFRRSARRLDKSSSPSMRAPVGSGGSIRQVTSDPRSDGERPTTLLWAGTASMIRGALSVRRTGSYRTAQPVSVKPRLLQIHRVSRVRGSKLRSPGCPPGVLRASDLLRIAGAVRRVLGVSDGLVGEVGGAALDGLGVEEAHGFLSLISAKRRSPTPSTTGKIFSRSSSTRSCSISVRSSWKLSPRGGTTFG